jgi:Tol biopolymer transport system component/DNA-binding winged helix-turn-helix (wHTH) protein
VEKRVQKRYEFGPFLLELEPWRLMKQGVEVPLRKKGQEILLLLIENAGHMIVKEEILSRVWPERVVEESNLSQHIHLLRRALEDDLKNQDYILTIPGKGYLFNQEVRVVVEPSNELSSTSTSLSYGLAGVPAASEQGNDPQSPAHPSLPTSLSSSSDRRGTSRPALKWGLSLLVAGALASGLYLVKRSQSRSGPPSLMPLSSSIIVPVVTLPGQDSHPRFSPDGQFLAFSSEGYGSASRNIYLQRVADGNLTRLTNDPRSDSFPTWSPDSSEIAFLREPIRSGDPYDVMIVPAGGGDAREVGQSWGGLAWSPDGKSLAITYLEKDRPESRLALIPIQGGPIVPVSSPLSPSSSNSVLFESYPKFSRDGQFLAFVRWKSDINADLHLVDLRTRVIRRLTFDEVGIPALEWTEDSREIIFSSDRRRPRQMWRLPLSGGEPIPIDLLPFDVDYLTIHPSGKMIAFTQSRNDSKIEISQLTPPASGSSPVCTINSSLEDDSARFSPDGKWIAFHSTRTGYHELWLAKSDCTEVRQLTQLKSDALGSPRWSPDGSRIAFDHHIDGNSEIFTIGIDGRELRRLTNDPVSDSVPSWSKDGTWVYFSSGRSRSNQVWKVPSSGGPAVQVTFKGGLEAMESEDGKTLYYNYRDRLNSLDFATGVEAPLPELSGISVDRHWQLTPRALFYAPIRPDGRSQLHRLDLTTRKVTPLFDLKKTFVRWLPRFAVSPDEKLLATYYYEYRLGDILLLKEQAN